MILKITIPDEAYKDYIEVCAKINGYKKELKTEEGIIKNPDTKEVFLRNNLAQRLFNMYQSDKMIAARQEVKEKALTGDIEFKVD